MHKEEDSFYNCPRIQSNYTIISNNSPTCYGVASLTKNYLNTDYIQFDSEGRVFVFATCGMTVVNVYLTSGSSARAARENHSSIVLPRLLLHHKDIGCIGCDLNSIIERKDCSENASAKMSPSFDKLVKTFDMEDCYRALHPNGSAFSRYYPINNQGGQN